MVFLGWGDRDQSLGQFVVGGIPERIANGFIQAFCDTVANRPPYPFNYLFEPPGGPAPGSISAQWAATVQRACRFAAVNPVRTLAGTTSYTVPGLCEIRGQVVLEPVPSGAEFTLGINLGDCSDPVAANKPGFPQGPPFISESFDSPGTVELYLPCQRPGENGYFQSLSGPIDPTIARIVGVRNFSVTPCTPAPPDAVAKYPVVVVQPDFDINVPVTFPVGFDLALNPQLTIPVLVPFTLIRPTANVNVSPQLRFAPTLNGQLRLDLAPTIEIGLGGITIGGGESVNVGDIIEIVDGVEVDCPECDCPTAEEISDNVVGKFERQVLKLSERQIVTVAIATSGGTFTLPANTVSVRIENLTNRGKMRSQAGSGTSPGVFYAGWYSFATVANRAGARHPLSFQNQAIVCPLQTRAVTVSLNFGAVVDVFAEIETGYD